MLDGWPVSRGAVERRLAAAARQADVSFGWARFPEDGLTLDDLIGFADAQLRPLRQRSGHPRSHERLTELDATGEMA
jgi:hypothetical protein